MKHITFYLDFISPYAYLAFERLPQLLMGLSHTVTYKPVLLGALLQEHGQLGPAEIAPKRDWTYRHVQWLAHEQQIELQLPTAHPFNPLPLLRLALARSDGGTPNRYVCETLFHHVWRGGGDALDPVRLQAVTTLLAPGRAADSEVVKAELRAHTDAAVAQGVFGVPAFEVDGRLFWGVDALPMLRAYLEGARWFEGPAWNLQIPVGMTRKP